MFTSKIISIILLVCLIMFHNSYAFLQNRHLPLKKLNFANIYHRKMGNILQTTAFGYLSNWYNLYVTRWFGPRRHTQNHVKFATSNINDASSILPGIDIYDLNKVWNLNGLKQEVSRNYLRTFKKIEKINERINRAIISSETSVKNEDINDIHSLRLEMQLLKERLKDVASLEEDLKLLKSNSDQRFKDAIERAIALNINDQPPPRPEKPVKKPKAVPSGPRKPYYQYRSVDNIIIRVGRSASDNDELSLNKEHRDQDHWWLHVAGCPGSHVVIMDSDDNLPTTKRDTLIDAALLAAVNSKISQAGRVQVTYTRCRHVTKPYGAKPGLVFLKDEVATTRVDIKAETSRLERLLVTKE